PRAARRGTPAGRSTGPSREPLEIEIDHAREADPRLVRQLLPAVEIAHAAIHGFAAPGQGSTVDRGAQLRKVLDAELPGRGALEPRVLARDVQRRVERQVGPH